MRYRHCLRLAFLFLAAAAFLLSLSHAASREATTQEKPSVSSNLQIDLTYEQRGDILMAHRQYMEAIDMYRKAPRSSAVTWNKLGIAYHHLFAFDQAKTDYLWALHLNPKYGEAMNNLAAVYYSEKDYRGAVKLYRRALKLIPSSAIAYSNLGSAYFAEGKFKEGTEAYRNAFALDPSVFSGNTQQPIAENSTSEDRARLNYCLAELYAHAGMKEQAIEYLKKAVNSGFSNEKQLLQDPEFAGIRQSAEFAQVVSLVKHP
jgi:tetratricopeptide (TPR) repeat protein